jgi:iron complex outermembrane receptor protein
MNIKALALAAAASVLLLSTGAWAQEPTPERKEGAEPRREGGPAGPEARRNEEKPTSQPQAEPAPPPAPKRKEGAEPRREGAPARPEDAREELGTIRGKVTDNTSGKALKEATVEVEGTELSTRTEKDGSYVFRDMKPGTHKVIIKVPGYENLAQSVTVSAGQEAVVDLGLTHGRDIEEVVITATRTKEKILDAPTTVEAVTSDELALKGGSSYLAALSHVKGIDYAESGISDKRISARGFNNQFNSRMIYMHDGRLATLPGSGIPQAGLMPTTSLDMKSIELIIGPSSALYGPNAHTGVVNVITKTPWDQSGAAISLRGGSNKLFDVSARVAGILWEDFGWKVNAQYNRAEEFAPDPDATTHLFGSPTLAQAGKPLIYEGDLLRDGYDIYSAKAEGFLYYRFPRKWIAKAGYGFSLNEGFSMTNAGRNHIRGWQVHYQTAQVSHPNWFAQFTRTYANSGDTYSLDVLATLAQATLGRAPTTDAEWDQVEELSKKSQVTEGGAKFIDQSQLYDSELQYRNELFGLKFVTGFQFRRYEPDSGGTYLMDAQGQDLGVNELGGYLLLDYGFLENDRLRVVGAARVDDHSNYSPQFSPSAAMVFKMFQGHNVRVGYGRAFKSPTVLENFLYLPSIAALGNSEGYTLRDPSGNVIKEVPGLEPEKVDNLELGYKGIVGRRLFIDAVGYHSWYQNFLSPLSPQADGANTVAYGADGNKTFVGSPSEGKLMSYTNYGAARVLGFDIGAKVFAHRYVTVGASGSYIHLLNFDKEDQANELLLNVPGVKLKGFVQVQNIGIRNWFTRLSGRYQSAYEFASGRWNSEVFFPDDDGKIPGRFVADLHLGYKFDFGLSLAGVVSNLFNDKGIDILGAPRSGIYGYAQATYSYDGLDYL